MSLQDIQLSPLALTELYRDVLVSIDAMPKAAPGKADVPVNTAPPKKADGAVKAALPGQTDGKTRATPPVADALSNAADDKPIQAPAKPIEAKISEIPLIASESPKADHASDSKPITGRIKFLGGNNKRIAFIVNCKTDVFLPDSHLDWLKKMLEACRLNLGDVAIANIAKTQFTITDIKQELFSNTVVLLGTEPAAIQLPLNFPHFNLQSHDGITFLATPPPEQLNQQTQEARLLKSKLWVSLQKLFKL